MPREMPEWLKLMARIDKYPPHTSTDWILRVTAVTTITTLYHRGAYASPEPDDDVSRMQSLLPILR